MKIGRTLLVAALAVSPLAWGEVSETPDRIAQLSYVEGQIRFQGAGEQEGYALPNRPLAAGDRLATRGDARAEISLGSAAVRLDEQSALAIEMLDATEVQMRLDSGVVSVTLRDLLEGESVQIATPNATIRLEEPGDYRVEAPTDDLSILVVRGGAATVETDAGPVRVTEGQRARLQGREALASLEPASANDAFDEWVLGREDQLADAETPSEDTQNEELQQYGEWRDDPNYGRVWTPAYAYGGYNPFHGGYWQPVGFGWSWVDPYPWGQFGFNDGRWAYSPYMHRWCWVPARNHHPHEVANDPLPVHPPIPIDPIRRPILPRGVPVDGEGPVTPMPSRGGKPRAAPPIVAKPVEPKAPAPPKVDENGSSTPLPRASTAPSPTVMRPAPRASEPVHRPD